MRMLPTLASLFACAFILHAEEISELPHHPELARKYAAATGQTYEICLQALKVGTWCRAHPQGGVANGKTYDAVATAELLLEATKVLNTKPVTTQPGVSAEEQRQQRMALHYSQVTNQRYEACLNAVRICDWCSSHPSGGTVNGVVYDRAARNQQFDLAMKFLGLAAPAPVAAAPAAVGRVLESSIDGEFEGFEGDKVFKLLNGQVWQQMDFTFNYHYAYSPRVMIYQAASGTMMKVDGVDKAVRVMQLR